MFAEKESTTGRNPPNSLVNCKRKLIENTTSPPSENKKKVKKNESNKKCRSKKVLQSNTMQSEFTDFETSNDQNSKLSSSEATPAPKKLANKSSRFPRKCKNLCLTMETNLIKTVDTESPNVPNCPIKNSRKSQVKESAQKRYSLNFQSSQSSVFYMYIWFINFSLPWFYFFIVCFRLKRRPLQKIIPPGTPQGTFLVWKNLKERSSEFLTEEEYVKRREQLAKKCLCCTVGSCKPYALGSCHFLDKNRKNWQIETIFCCWWSKEEHGHHTFQAFLICRRSNEDKHKEADAKWPRNSFTKRSPWFQKIIPPNTPQGTFLVWKNLKERSSEFLTEEEYVKRREQLAKKCLCCTVGSCKPYALGSCHFLDKNRKNWQIETIFCCWWSKEEHGHHTFQAFSICRRFNEDKHKEADAKWPQNLLSKRKLEKMKIVFSEEEQKDDKSEEDETNQSEP